MVRGHERARFLFPVFIMLFVLYAVSGKSCEELQCLNSNSCESVITTDNITHARCVCSGKWAGPRCEHSIRLKPESVTSSQAKLKVDLLTSQQNDVKMTTGGSSVMSLVSSKEQEELKLNYTLVYWRRNDTITSLTSDSSFLTSGEITCVLLHRRSSKQPTLEGLLPRTRYTICIENGFIDSCVLSSFTDFSSLSSSLVASSRSGVTSSWPSNCVTIFTPKQPLPLNVITKSSTVTTVAVASVLILIVLIVVFTLFLVRRQSVGVRLCMDNVFRRCCCTCWCCKSESSCDSSVDRSYLHHSSSHRSGSGTDFLEEDTSRGDGGRRTVLDRFRLGKKRPKSSSYTSADMLLPQPPAASLSAAFNGSEASPLDSELDEVDLNDDSVFENNPEEPSAGAALPTIHRPGHKARHRLSRKRRGYVAYLSKKGKNIKLTTVLETPVDDDPCDAGLMGDVESPVQ